MTSMRDDAIRREAADWVVRLGRATDWLQIGEGGPTRGIGAVTLVVGEDSKTWLEMDSIEFQSAT